MNDAVTLLRYFPDYRGDNSLFQKMVPLGAPWTDDIARDMDIVYFTMYSGIKNPSGFVKLNSTNDIANSSDIASILFSMYKEPWIRLWNAYTSEYTPLDNYNIKETVDRTETDDRNINKVNKFDSVVDSTADMTDTSSNTTSVEYGQQIDKTAIADEYNYGFNSGEKVPVHSTEETGEEKHSGTDTTTSNGTDTTDSTAKTTTDDSGNETTSDNSDIKENIQRTRQGNVGQNTYQELLSQEFELWKWNFYNQIFEDVDKYLALSVYTCH